MISKYLTLDERIKQHIYAYKGYSLFDVGTVTLQSKVTETTHTLESFSIYARNEKHAESLKNRIVYRFGEDINADLNQKSLGLLTDKNSGFGLVELFTFQVWKDPAFKRQFRTNKPGTIPLSYLKSIFLKLTPKNKTVDLSSIEPEHLYHLQRNAKICMYSYASAASILVISLITQLLTLDGLNIHEFIFISGKFILAIMFVYSFLVVKLDIQAIKERLK